MPISIFKKIEKKYPHQHGESKDQQNAQTSPVSCEKDSEVRESNRTIVEIDDWTSDDVSPSLSWTE